MRYIILTLTLLFSLNINSQTAEEFFYTAIDKSRAKDYVGALNDYNKAIELNPNYYDAYYNRGVLKYNSSSLYQDLKGAISDFSVVIKHNPKDEDAYYNRAGAKFLLEDYEGAINDFGKVLEINPRNGDAFFMVAPIKKLIGKDGCEDIKKARQLGVSFPINEVQWDEFFKSNCN